MEVTAVMRSHQKMINRSLIIYRQAEYSVTKSSRNYAILFLVSMLKLKL